MVAVPNVVFYDDKDAGRPLVRFAFCKRLDVLDEAVDATEGARRVRVAAIQHDIVWEDRDANFAHLAPMIGDAARQRRAARRAHRDVLDRLLDGDRARSPSRSTARARSSSSSRRARTACGCAARCPSVQPGDDAAVEHVSCSPRPTAPSHRYGKIHPFSLRRRARALRRGRRARHRRRRGRPAARLFVCYDLRFADEFWAVARDTDCYVVVGELARAAARPLAHAAARPRDREPGVRRRRQPRRAAAAALDYAGDSAIVRRSAARWRRPAPSTRRSSSTT